MAINCRMKLYPRDNGRGKSTLPLVKKEMGRGGTHPSRANNFGSIGFWGGDNLTE